MTKDFRTEQHISSQRHKILGIDRMVSNVLTSWGMQFVFIVAGFIIPRMIDNVLGQVQLGIWDFCWSIVAYFKLVKAGIVSSINPFVAKFRAAEDYVNVNVSISSVTAVLVVMGSVVILLSAMISYLLPIFFSKQLGQHISDSQIIILFLGTSLSLEIVQSGFSGILTGCHRWDIQNGINATVRLFTLGAMVTGLLLKGGLIHLAAIEMAGEIIGFIFRLIAVKMVFRELELKPSLISSQRIKEMMSFGGKTFIPTIGQLLSGQTIRLLIVWYMGPAFLALFARPTSLITSITTFVSRYAFVFTPTASSILALGDQKGIQDLALQATRYGAFLTIPTVLTVAILGGPIIHVWMGPEYENQMLITILSLGTLPFLLQMPANSILRGFNAHGRPGVARLAGSLISAILVAICLGVYKMGIIAVALSAVIPLALEESVLITYIYLKIIRVSWRTYLRESLASPLLCSLPLLIITLTIRLFFMDNIHLGLIVALVSSGIVTSLLYYRFALPPAYKEKLFLKLGNNPFSGKKK